MKRMLSGNRHQYLAAISILLIFSVTVVLTAGMVGCGGGEEEEEEEEEKEFTIQNWYHLDAVRNKLGADYVCILENDLDRNTAGWGKLASETANGGKGWKPIGNDTDPFKGKFNGNGHTISDLYIYRPDEDQVGLFGYVREAGLKLKNITVLEANVTGREKVGILVGENQGTLEHCCSSGIVTGNHCTGGLVGWHEGYGLVSSSVRFCNSTATIRGGKWNTGGLVGYNGYKGIVEQDMFGGDLTGVYQVGGVVGLNNYEIKYSDLIETGTVTGVRTYGGVVGRTTFGTIVEGCHRYGKVCKVGEVCAGLYTGCDALLSEVSAVTSLSIDSYETDWYVGGVLGVNEGTVKDCTSEGIVYGGNYVGGVVAANNGTVENCSSDSSVYGENYVGGVVAANNGTVENCSSDGSVTGKDYVGGLVAYNAKVGIVSNSNSAADVEGTGIYVGDLVGWNEGVVTGCFWAIRHSTYKLICDVPEVIVAGEETTIPVTLKTDELGELGYDGVQLHLKVYPRAGDVTIKLYYWSSTNELYSQEYDLPADYNQTIYPLVYCSEPGEYTFTFSLIEAPYGPVIDNMTESITVSVVEA